MISNIRDNGQVSLLAPKFFSRNIQCYVNEKSNVEILQSVNAGLKAPECICNGNTQCSCVELFWKLGLASLCDDECYGVDDDISMKVKLWKLICFEQCGIERAK